MLSWTTLPTRTSCRPAQYLPTTLQLVSHSLSLSLFLTYTHFQSLSLWNTFLSFWNTHTHTHSLNHLSLSFSLFLTPHTQTHTHSLSFSLSLFEFCSSHYEILTSRSLSRLEVKRTSKIFTNWNNVKTNTIWKWIYSNEKSNKKT